MFGKSLELLKKVAPAVTRVRFMPRPGSRSPRALFWVCLSRRPWRPQKTHHRGPPP
jgi:hypothetical protein